MNEIHALIEPLSGLRKWLTAILLSVALALAALPPLFVLLDRWAAVPELKYFPKDNWCQVDFLCKTAFPAYFLSIFLFLAALTVLLLVFAKSYLEPLPVVYLPPEVATPPAASTAEAKSVSRTLIVSASVGLALSALLSLAFHRVPAWELLLIAGGYLVGFVLGECPVNLESLSARWAAFVSRLPLYGSVALFYTGLVLFLREISSFERFQWIYLGLVILGAAAIYTQRRSLGKVFWLVTLAVILFSLQVNSWKYAVIGDEYSFFTYSTESIRKQSIFQVAESLFNGQAVYADHPYLSSLIQHATMLLLGFESFGWRFSSLFLAALSIPFYYGFFKAFIPERPAFLAVTLLALSQYLINFGKIGYNNLQALFLMGVILWGTMRALRAGTPTAYALLGMAMAGCFYVYPAALYILPLPLLLLLFYNPPVRRPALRLWFYLLFGLVLFMVPLFFQPKYWQNKIEGTLFYNAGLISSGEKVAFHFASNFLYSLFSYLYLPQESHFVVSSYLDPLSAVFVPIGALWILRSLRRNRFWGFVVLAYLLEILLVGTTHDRDFPANTRMFLLLPWFFLFAALGIHWVVGWLGRLFSPPGLALRLSLALIVAGIAAANLYQANVIFRERTAGIPGVEALFLRMLQHDAREAPGEVKEYLFLTGENWGIDGLRQIQEVYHLPDSKAQLQRAVVDSPLLTIATLEQISDEATLVIIQPSLDANLKSQLGDLLKQQGKQSCDIRDTPEKAVVFQLWYSPKYEVMCKRALSQE